MGVGTRALFMLSHLPNSPKKRVKTSVDKLLWRQCISGGVQGVGRIRSGRSTGSGKGKREKWEFWRSGKWEKWEGAWYFAKEKRLKGGNQEIRAGSRECKVREAGGLDLSVPLPSPSKKNHLPLWPSNVCATSLDCRFQIYTMLSSDPDTIHWKYK